MGRLHLDEAFQCAKVIAEVQVAGRLDAGEHAFGKSSHFLEPLISLELRRLMATRRAARKSAAAFRPSRWARSAKLPSSANSRSCGRAQPRTGLATYFVATLNRTRSQEFKP